ncbi:MAG: DUF975 family protein [Oscillospiraceae bacterium]|nr:DUF975 family protein [Oscillospiraceae bacterium]
MVDRKAVKSRGKLAFQSNYWRCVLVALLALILLGGGGAAGRSGGKTENDSSSHSINFNSFSDLKNYVMQETGLDSIAANGLLAVIGAAAGVASLVVFAIKLLLINPIEVGCCWFFMKNGDAPASVGELKRAFEPQWLNNVLTLFLRDLFIALWAILFVIPGIIMAYAYRMTPYILAEHPEMRGSEAIKASKEMMKGYKWEAFVYDISFIGWYFLDILTLGILGIFYVHPYKEASDAELYYAISERYYANSSSESF